MTTSTAWLANASRSPGSDVSTVPPGSANATTSASTAEPRRARRRSRAARRATDSGITCAISQVFRNLFPLASRPAWPWRHSTKTTDGTLGGQSPSSRNARINASPPRERSARRVTPPESRTNTKSNQPYGGGENARRLVWRPQSRGLVVRVSALPPGSEARSCTFRWPPSVLGGGAPARTASCSNSDAGSPRSFTSA